VQPDAALSGIGDGDAIGTLVVVPAAGLSNALALFSTLPSGALGFEEIWTDGVDGEVGLGGASDADVFEVDADDVRVAVAAPGDNALGLWSLDDEDPGLAFLDFVTTDANDPDLDDFVSPIAVE
jgi:hypothetical protein